jgi:serine/threonine protein kinase
MAQGDSEIDDAVELGGIDYGALGSTLAAPSETPTSPGESGSQASGAPARVPAARFARLSRLAEGGMGAVDVARDVYLKRKVALKSMLPSMARHESIASRFVTEMQVTAQLEHPNIVPVYAVEPNPDGSLGYAMKLVRGKELEQLIDEARALTEAGKPLPAELSLATRLEIFLEVCAALSYAHERGIVHRDLKPANIMVGKHHDVYVMDWGIARPIGRGGKALDTGIEIGLDASLSAKATGPRARTALGAAVGTPMYMSPEQALAQNDELDGRSDLYTLGLILQELVTLKPAIDGRTLDEVLTKAKEAKREPLTPVGSASIPRELRAIVEKATARDAAQRYASVSALADDVRRHLRDEPTVALPDDGVRKVTRWLAKHRTGALGLLLGVTLLGAAGTITMQQVGQAKLSAAYARDLRQSELATEAAIAAQLLDRQLGHYEAALSKFVGAAQATLTQPGPPGAVFFEADFATPATAPPDFGPSKRYGQPVSVLTPVVWLAPSAPREGADAIVKGVVPGLAVAFQELFADVGGDTAQGRTTAEVRQLLAEAGTAAERARLVLPIGIALSYPGTAGAAPLDPWSEPPYRAAERKVGVFWSEPMQRGATSVLAVSSSVYAGGGFRGVAVLEVALDRLLDVPGKPKLDYVQTQRIVSRSGKVLAERSDERGAAPLSQGVLDSLAAGKSGTMEYEDQGKRWVASYYAMSALDWHYVSVAQLDQMVKSQAPVAVSDPRKPRIKPSAPASAPPPAPRPPTPAPSASAPEADAGAAEADAGAPLAAPSASVPRYMPAAKVSAAPAPAVSAPAAASAPPPPPIPANPFEPWKSYENRRKK